MSDDDASKTESLARTRGRRDLNGSSKNAAKNAAFERLKNLRGSKNKYEVSQVENVYDIVDEATYTKKVHDRLKDDWIVDDGNGLYSENGHELFDDDLVDDDDDYGHSSKGGRNKKEKKPKLSKAERETQKAGMHSLRDMWSNVSTKRKRDENESHAKVDDDVDLDDLMQELHEEKKPKLHSTSLKYVESSKNDSFLSGKIKHDDSFSKTPVNIQKKKFVPFKVVQQPIEIKEEVVWDDMDDIMGEMETEQMEAVEQVDIKPVIINPPSREPASSSKSAVTKVKMEEVPKVPSKFQLDPNDSFEEMGTTKNDNDVKIITTDVLDSSISINAVDESGHAGLNFYWLDMFEEPKNPGVLYLFGKIQTSTHKFASCCLVVKSLERVVYLLPRSECENGETVSSMDLYREFADEIAPRFKISTFKSRTVEKKYCFDLQDVPQLSEYMEIRYSGNLPSLPMDLSGKTFSRIFGSASPLMENFLLEKKFKGPSWLKVSNAVKVDGGQQSWCKFEFTCDVCDIALDSNTTLPIPPLVMVALNIQTVNDPATKRDSIVFVGAALHSNFHIQSQLKDGQYFDDHFSLFNKPPGEVWPLDADKKLPNNRTTSKLDSERALLGCLLAKLQQYDADVFVGHDLNYELLIMQLINHKVPHWSRIGRLKRTSNIGKGNKTLDYRSVMAGRLMCDVKISAKELIRARSYELPTLASQILDMDEDKVMTLSGPEIKQRFDSSLGLQWLKNNGMTQAITCIRLVDRLQVLPLALQITTIAGNTLSRTLLGGRSERNEYLLLHAFYSKGYIVPDKFKPFKGRIKQEPGTGEEEGKDKNDKKSNGPAYAGGLVLNPKKGFYDNFIVLMDFNSLYPSIIQEYNICFTTSSSSADDAMNEPTGVLPEEIRKLVESRRQVKSLMKGEVPVDLMRQYDIRQKALKLTANSMYGCLGFKFSRFYAKELAALVTGKGREILMRTKDVVEKLGFEVIYGDTDSLMINSNSREIEKVYQIGNKIKGEINRMYKLLELEIDGIFRFLLLLKKKKYAALLYNKKANGDVEHVLELKGLDIVRRDWAPVAASTAKLILNEIMTEQQLDDKVFKVSKILGDIATKLRDGEVPINDLLITKQLAKNPEEYKGAQGLYHVQVALRMNQGGKLTKKFRNGDTVPYLFCTDGLPHHPRELDIQPTTEVKTESGGETKPDIKPLVADAAYYLTQQVHPVVSRICEPIPGLDAAQIAESLGLDPTAFKKRRSVEDESQEDKFLGEQSEKEKYRDCERFSFQCQNTTCGQTIIMESPFVGVNHEIGLTLASCRGCHCSLLPTVGNISNKLTLFIRKLIGKYYRNDHNCEDPCCTNSDRGMPIQLERFKGYYRCRGCTQALMVPDYSSEQLYKQLIYLQYLFDIPKHEEHLNTTEKDEIRKQMNFEKKLNQNYVTLKNIVSKTIQQSAYSDIDLGALFAGVFVSKKQGGNSEKK